MTFVSVDPATLPKRSRALSDDAKATRDALVAALTPTGAVSDGVSYETEKEARKVAGKMRRLLLTLPAGTLSGVPGTRIAGEGPFTWTIVLREPRKAKKAKSK